MLSREQEDQFREKQTLLAQLKADYKVMFRLLWSKVSRKDPALIDMLAQLDTWGNDAKNKADTELDDSVKVMVYLHEANVYFKLKKYIDSQLS